MRRSILLVTLASMVLVLGACQDEPPSPVQPGVSSPFSGGDFTVTSSGFEPTPDYILESLEYEEFHGTIIPGEGGFLMGQMSTWPGGSYFSIQVPPEALPDDPGSGAVNFSIRIPTRQSYVDYQHLNGGRGLPLIMDMEPSGLLFAVPVHVSATWMPWSLVGTKIEDWDLWCLDPELTYYELESVRKVKKTVMLTYKAPHFSRWEAGGPPPR